jgi:hypothetical protein
MPMPMRVLVLRMLKSADRQAMLVIRAINIKAVQCCTTSNARLKLKLIAMPMVVLLRRWCTSCLVVELEEDNGVVECQ